MFVDRVSETPALREKAAGSEPSPKHTHTDRRGDAKGEYMSRHVHPHTDSVCAHNENLVCITTGHPRLAGTLLNQFLKHKHAQTHTDTRIK